MHPLTVVAIIVFLVIVHIVVTLAPNANYNRLIDYLVLRKLGIRREKCWEIAGMSTVGDRAVGVLCGIIAVIGILYLMSSYANAEVHQSTGPKDAYIKSLEGIVASCIDERKFGAIKIGDEWFACGITPLGSFK